MLGQAVDVQHLEHTLSHFFQARIPSVPAVPGSGIIVVDGKTVRGTIPHGHTSSVHLVAAYVPASGVVLAQMAVARKENEIVVVPTLLAELTLTGQVVVGDAMQTQRALSRQIVESGGDYLWFVKDNQPSLRDDIDTVFRPPPLAAATAAPPTDVVTVQQIDKGHGRLEVRTLTASSLLQPYSDWPYLAQVFKLERVVARGGASTTDVRYGVTSLPVTVANAQRLLTIARTGWQIENGDASWVGNMQELDPDIRLDLWSDTMHGVRAQDQHLRAAAFELLGRCDEEHASQIPVTCMLEMLNLSEIDRVHQAAR